MLSSYVTKIKGGEYMSNQKIQMNVRVPKELKQFAINDAKNQFHSLSQYIEKLMFKAKELSELEKK